MIASIQKIIDVRPIPDADAIEVAKVLGWDVVVKKNEFKPGDLCVFIEVDSILPRKDWSEFLFKSIEDTEYRLRTVKLRKQISQGLVLPPSILPHWGIVTMYVGDDVSDILGVKHYEKPISDNPRSGIRAKGRFPYFLRKTDEERIQNAPWLLEQMQGKEYNITVKLDGTSATYYKYKGVFGVCSRNMEIKNPYGDTKSFIKLIVDKIKIFLNKAGKKSHPRTHSVDMYWKMAEKYNIAEWLPEGYAIQGEICGEGIQKNKLGLVGNDLFIFNIWNIEKQSYSERDLSGVMPIVENAKFVPILDSSIFSGAFNYTLEDLQKMANELKYENGTPAEGIVVRDIQETISFKVISQTFQLKYGE